MKSFRVLAVSVLVFIISLMAACGGGGSKPPTPPAPLSITTELVPTATVNIFYNFFLQGSGGSGTYAWSLDKGTLPDGLTLDSGFGEITGTPTTFGKYSFTVKLTDGTGTSVTKDLTMTVEGVMVINCNSCAPGTFTLPAGNPGVPYMATLSATGGQMPFTWCVVEPNGLGCDDGHLGGLPAGLTIATNSDGTATISGTPTTPGTPSTVTVQVSDSETVVSRGSANLTLTIFDLAPKTLPNGILNTPYNQSLVAVGGIAPWTWTLTGSLPPGLRFGTCVAKQTPNCAITGTPTQVGTTTFSVTVTDGETPPASASATISITIGPLATNSTLNGTYAIAFNGFKSGNPFVMAGSVIADGNGNITSGKLDYNDGSGEQNDPNGCLHNPVCPIAQTIQSGSSYDLSTNGDGTGKMTLSTIDGSGNPHTFHFDITVSGTGCTSNKSLSSCGRLIETDSQQYGSGVLKAQDPDYFLIQSGNRNSFLPGNFALLEQGVDPAGHRFAAAGAIGFNPNTLVDIDCNGNGWHLDGCPLDTNDNGNGGSGATVSDPFKGQFSANVDSVTGRGSFVNMTYPNHTGTACGTPGQGGALCGYVYYVVNYAEMIMISTDPQVKSGNPFAPLTYWSGFRQGSNARGWSLSSILAANVVDLNANDGGKSDVTSGLLTSDLAGNGTFTSDENDGGTINSQTAAPGTFALGSSGNLDGQFLLSGFPQFGAGGAVMYLWSGNGGAGFYLVGTDAKVTAGTVEVQLPSPSGSFSNGSVSGNYSGGSVWPVLAAVTNSVTSLHADGASPTGSATGPQYTSGSGGVNGPDPLTLTYQVDATGRGVVSDQAGNQYGFLYVVSPNKFSLVPTGNNPALNIFITGQPD